MSYPKRLAYRVAVAVAFGLIGFGVNFLDIEFMEGATFKISIPAGLFFPLVVTLAWGRRIPVEITLGLTTVDQGRPQGINAIFRDISERKQAEEALRQSHAMLVRTERIANVGSWEWDIAGDRVRWSDELFRIFGRAPAAGAPSFAQHPELYLPEDMQRLREAIERGVSQETPYELELRAIRSNGEMRTTAGGMRDSCPGTTFKIYLPRHLAKAVSLPEKQPDKPGERGHETVLLVEDEPAILRMTTLMLEREGYTVVEAGTPGEAIRLANEQAGDIHLLITDVVMPEMNGRELAKNILSRYPHLKCLFMSGHTANVIAHHGVLDEGVNFIQKPFAKGDLTVQVRKVLDRD